MTEQAPSIPARTISILTRHSLTWASLRLRSDLVLESQEGLIMIVQRDWDPPG